MDRDRLFPYLMPGDPGPEFVTVAVGHGLSAQLFEDRESDAGIVQTALTPEQLRDTGLTPAEAHRLALDNLVRFADDSPDLSIQMLGAVGDPVNFLLYSDHPRASSCLLLPDLYEHSRDLLQSDELCACVPQRESLVVLPRRDRAYREMLVARLREIEADAERPLSFGLFEVTAAGVKPLTEAP